MGHVYVSSLIDDVLEPLQPILENLDEEILSQLENSAYRYDLGLDIIVAVTNQVESKQPSPTLPSYPFLPTPLHPLLFSLPIDIVGNHINIIVFLRCLYVPF